MHTGVYDDLDNFGRPTKCRWSRLSADLTAGTVNTTPTYDRNSNPLAASNLVGSDSTTGIRPRDFLYTVDGLNRVTFPERGDLASGSITNLNWRQESPSLTLTGN